MQFERFKLAGWFHGVAAFAGVLCIVGSLHAGTTRDVIVVAAEGEPAAGSGDLVTVLNAPFTNGDGKVGFTGAVDDSGSNDGFVWYDTGVVFLNSSALPEVVLGGESSMGIGNGGEYVYSPVTNGVDSIRTDAGTLVSEGDLAPGILGSTLTFTSRPLMIDDGTAHFVAGITSGLGGETEARVLYRSVGGTITRVLESGDNIGGLFIDFPVGVGFSYDFSRDGSHHIHLLDMATGSAADDDFVFVDGALMIQEGEPTGDGDHWQSFDLVGINDSGTYFFTGDTDGVTGSDEFLAVNGEIVIREGDTVDGVTLSGATVRAASINNRGQIAHLWSTGSGSVLFVGDAAELASSSIVVLQTGDGIDREADGMTDAVLIDFNANAVNGQDLCLSDDLYAFVEVTLEDSQTSMQYEAIVRVDIPGACTAGNINVTAGDRMDVLDVNGSTGGARRTVRVPTDEAITLGLESAGGTGHFLLYAWVAEPENPTDLVASGRVGCMSNPSPFSSEGPLPTFCLPGAGIPSSACQGLITKGAPDFAPFSLTKGSGLSNPIVLTFQGVLRDVTSDHAKGFSVTNAVTLIVE